jgi:uncharacterized protein (TIGR02145 family)
MARIQTYDLDTTINANDKIIGTDGAEGANHATKNFTVDDLKTFILEGVTGGGDISGSGTATQMAIFDSTSTITSTQAVVVNGSNQIIMDMLLNSASYPDDAAALAGGVPQGGLYRSGNAVRINLLESNPGSGVEEVQIGNLIWTTANSTIVASSGGTIPILTTDQEVNDASNNSTAAAVYYDFNSANEQRGLLYNKQAAAAITPPSGFRLPNNSDWANLANELDDISGTINYVTAGGGGANALWSSGIKANADYGSSGFNSIGAGGASFNLGSLGFYLGYEQWWTEEGLTSSTPEGRVFLDQSTYIKSGSTYSGIPYWYIRFCKDA